MRHQRDDEVDEVEEELPPQHQFEVPLGVRLVRPGQEEGGLEGGGRHQVPLHGQVVLLEVEADGDELPSVPVLGTVHVHEVHLPGERNGETSQNFDTRCLVISTHT